jgi:hypothetical protein
MKKFIPFLVVFAIGVALFATERKSVYMPFRYENTLRSTSSTAKDTVTGVAVAAASQDTILISTKDTKGNVAAEFHYVITTTDVNNQDTTLYNWHRQINNIYETTPVRIDTVLATAGIEYYNAFTSGIPPDAYRLFVNGTLGADTDTTAYALQIRIIVNTDTR